MEKEEFKSRNDGLLDLTEIFRELLADEIDMAWVDSPFVLCIEYFGHPIEVCVLQGSKKVDNIWIRNKEIKFKSPAELLKEIKECMSYINEERDNYSKFIEYLSNLKNLSENNL